VHSLEAYKESKDLGRKVDRNQKQSLLGGEPVEEPPSRLLSTTTDRRLGRLLTMDRRPEERGKRWGRRQPGRNGCQILALLLKKKRYTKKVQLFRGKNMWTNRGEGGKTAKFQSSKSRGREPRCVGAIAKDCGWTVFLEGKSGGEREGTLPKEESVRETGLLSQLDLQENFPSARSVAGPKEKTRKKYGIHQGCSEGGGKILKARGFHPPYQTQKSLMGV